MTTLPTEQIVVTSPAISRAQGSWLIAMQIAALGLTALALSWARVWNADAQHWNVPGSVAQKLLLLLILAALAVAIVPAWRRSAAAGILGGAALALACSLSARKSWELELFPGASTPLILPVIVIAAVILAVWGIATRSKLADSARISVGALAGGVLVILFALGMYALVNYAPSLVAPDGSRLYAVEKYQLADLIAAALLYPLAIWLGAAGARAGYRWTFLPLGLVIILAGFLVLWKVH
ncbi:MAG: hypothetical protein ACYDBB_10965 [Armatimonadota bacterium]